jgi:hypothetical protein
MIRSFVGRRIQGFTPAGTTRTTGTTIRGTTEVTLDIGIILVEGSMVPRVRLGRQGEWEAPESQAVHAATRGRINPPPVEVTYRLGIGRTRQLGAVEQSLLCRPRSRRGRGAESMVSVVGRGLGLLAVVGTREEAVAEKGRVSDVPALRLRINPLRLVTMEAADRVKVVPTHHHRLLRSLHHPLLQVGGGHHRAPVLVAEVGGKWCLFEYTLVITTWRTYELSVFQ